MTNAAPRTMPPTSQRGDCEQTRVALRQILRALLIASALFLPAVHAAGQSDDLSVTRTLDRLQPRMVKIYGAGGFRGMEAYQTGMLVSAEGHILTAFSYVLDTDHIGATLDDGRKFKAKLLGADPRLEVAVLKIDAAGLPHFDLAQSIEVDGGTRVLALSNLFGVATGNEPASVQHGVIAAKTNLTARRGTYETPYRGPVYVVDMVTNNPGAAGGALVTRRGQLVAMLGKELRNAMNNTWLNYAIPIEQLGPSVDAIRDGRFVPDTDDSGRDKPRRSLRLESLGIVLVPDVLQRTPPYVDNVRPDSPAAAARVRPDDLILMLDGRLIQSCKSLRSELEFIDFEDPVTLTILRGQDILDVDLQWKLDEKPE
ncbi:MAG: S1C family serine protease [Thermoguttaceae bacterium]